MAHKHSQISRFSVFLTIYIYISRLQEETEFSLIERSPLELNRLVMEFACIKTDGRLSNLGKSLKSARPSVTSSCSPVHPLLPSSRWASIVQKIGIHQLSNVPISRSIHQELAYRIFIPPYQSAIVWLIGSLQWDR